MNIPVPNGSSLSLDLSEMRQLAGPYSVLSSFVDGNAPAEPVKLAIGSTGIVENVYSMGPRSVFPYSYCYGDEPEVCRVGQAAHLSCVGGGRSVAPRSWPGWCGFDCIWALEASTVDIASELTDMIEAQRNFTANSRVFQTSSELFDVLNRL